MFDRTNWQWVRSWAQRIFAAVFMLMVFAFMTASPLLRPGGAMATLPDALWFGAVVSLAVTVASGIALAAYSNRKGGRHQNF